MSPTLQHPSLQSWHRHLHWSIHTQIAKFMGPTWGPPGSCRPQMGPMLAPWTLLSGYSQSWHCHLHWGIHTHRVDIVTYTGASIPTELTLSPTLGHPYPQSWHCHLHWGIHTHRVDIVTYTGASIPTELTLSPTLEHPYPQSWQRHPHCSIHGCSVGFSLPPCMTPDCPLVYTNTAG